MDDQETTRKPRVKITRIIALFVGIMWLLTWLSSLNQAAPK